MTGTEWTTTVSDLVATFRSGIASLVPTLEQAHIPWRDEDAYDQWDEIASLLYRVVVAEPLSHAVAVPDIELAPYDMVLESYAAYSFIEVSAPGIPSGHAAALHRFVTDSAPFDVVEVVLLNDRTGAVVERGAPVRIDYTTCRFQLRVHAAGGHLAAVSEVTVPGE